MVSKMRLRRIAERMYEELSQMIIHDVKDPRLSGVFITDVSIDRELAFADVYVAAPEGMQRAEEVIEGFEHASGYIRSKLASRVELRTFPRLRFHWDATPERAAHIEELIASLHNGPSDSAEDKSSHDTKNASGCMDEEGGADG